jgi:hypothetical protein
MLKLKINEKQKSPFEKRDFHTTKLSNPIN